MYDWVTHTHNHLAGACPHACAYCSTQDMARRFPALAERYSGPPRLIEKELSVNYGTGKTIFVENCSDLFARGIDQLIISAILFHCCAYPENTYAFQTKNPRRVGEFLNQFPPRFLIGTTAETNWINDEVHTLAPCPSKRLESLRDLKCPAYRKFITIEPIMQFDYDDFLSELLRANVGTYYIGADSKSHGLPEPTGPEIKALGSGLVKAGKTVFLKSNLGRLYRGE